MGPNSQRRCTKLCKDGDGIERSGWRRGCAMIYELTICHCIKYSTILFETTGEKKKRHLRFTSLFTALRAPCLSSACSTLFRVPAQRLHTLLTHTQRLSHSVLAWGLLSYPLMYLTSEPDFLRVAFTTAFSFNHVLPPLSFGCFVLSTM